MSKLKHEIDHLREKVATRSQLNMEISNYKTKMDNKQLDNILDQQQQLKLQGAINDFASGIQLLIENTRLKNQNIIHSNPVHKIEKYLRKIKEQVGEYELPTVTDKSDYFDFGPRQVTIVDHIVTLTFVDIPLIYNEKYQEYLIISTPDPSNTSVHIAKNTFVMTAATNADNSTFIDTTDVHRLRLNLLERTYQQKKPLRCWMHLLKSRNQPQYQYCEKSIAPRKPFSIFFPR